MKTASQSHFAQNPSVGIKRSVFRRPSSHKTTINGNLLYPIFVDEVLPGDNHKINTAVMGRLTTPLKPMMDNIYLDIFYFFVPNRLLWSNWARFMGECDPDEIENPPSYTIPQLAIVATPGNTCFELAQYMGILPPYRTGETHLVSALPFRALNLIYNEWFRDQNLIDRAIVRTGDTGDLTTDFIIRYRAKARDYFTGCLPFMQKGPAVNLPLSGTADVVSDGTQPSFEALGGGTSQGLTAAQTTNNLFIGGTGLPVATAMQFGDNTGLQVQLNTATAITVNVLREAVQLQRLLERDARGGTRYTEIIRAHFDVISPDSRLQRPEFLGMGTKKLYVTEVAQTSVGSGHLGDLAGIGVVAGDGIGFSKAFTEHGWIIGLVNLRADVNYQTGIPKMYLRQTKLDFYWPALANLSEQAVKIKELFPSGNSGIHDDEEVFGYQERFAEYRYKPSLITGQFNSFVEYPLDSYHLAQAIVNKPELNEEFINQGSPFDRVLAIGSQPHLFLDLYFDQVSVRPMPMYGIPGMMDHF